MNIRKMTVSDYGQVYSLWLSCKGMGLNNLDDSEEGIRRFLLRNPDTCFVAEEDGIVIGVIMTGHDGRRGYIYHTAVNADFRRQGIAKELVKSSLKALEKCGINKVALLVFQRNETANKFWEEMGFTVRDDILYRNKALTEIERLDT